MGTACAFRSGQCCQKPTISMGLKRDALVSHVQARIGEKRRPIRLHVYADGQPGDPDMRQRAVICAQRPGACVTAGSQGALAARTWCRKSSERQGPMRHDPHSRCCILPPHILRTVAQYGSDLQRRIALDTLATDSTMRALRTGEALQELSVPAALGSAHMVAGQPQRTIMSAEGNQIMPGMIVRQEGDPASGDAAVDEAYEGLGAV